MNDNDNTISDVEVFLWIGLYVIIVITMINIFF